MFNNTTVHRSKTGVNNSLSPIKNGLDQTSELQSAGVDHSRSQLNIRGGNDNSSSLKLHSQMTLNEASISQMNQSEEKNYMELARNQKEKESKVGKILSEST